jgi:hypothetical protein
MRCQHPAVKRPPTRQLAWPAGAGIVVRPWREAEGRLAGCFCGSVGRQRLGRLDHQDGLVVSGRELAVAWTEEAHPLVAVVAGAVLGHGAFVDHG